MRISDWSSDVCSSDLRRSEADIVAALRTDLSRSPATVEAVTQRGLTLIRKAKAEGERETLVAQLMNRYRLSTEEGVVLMCLAEAQIGRASWRARVCQCV